jgi:hypothetical protein
MIIEGEILGKFFKNVIGAMVTSEIKFPLIYGEVEQLKDNSWYPLQRFSKILYEIAEKMPPIVMMKIGKNVGLAQNKMLEMLGIYSFEELIKDMSIRLTGLVRNVDLKKIIKTINYHLDKKILVAGFSTITPAAYDEGILRGGFQSFYKFIVKFDHIREGNIDIFTIEWR